MKTFTAEHTKSIRLFPNGFSLLKNENNTVISKDYYATPYSFLAQNAIAFFNTGDPDKSGIMVMDDIHPPVLIPKELFEGDNAIDYLKLQYQIEEPVKIYQDELGEYISLYFVKNEVVNALDKLPATCQFKHLTTLLYDHVHQHVLSGNTPGLLTFFMHEDFVDFILEKEGQIILINRFPFTTEFDVLYYTLNMVKQYGMETSTLELLLCNGTNKKIISVLKDYFPHLSIIK